MRCKRACVPRTASNRHQTTAATRKARPCSAMWNAVPHVVRTAQNEARIQILAWCVHLQGVAHERDRAWRTQERDARTTDDARPPKRAPHTIVQMRKHGAPEHRHCAAQCGHEQHETPTADGKHTRARALGITGDAGVHSLRRAPWVICELLPLPCLHRANSGDRSALKRRRIMCTHWAPCLLLFSLIAAAHAASALVSLQRLHQVPRHRHDRFRHRCCRCSSTCQRAPSLDVQQ